MLCLFQPDGGVDVDAIAALIGSLSTVSCGSR